MLMMPLSPLERRQSRKVGVGELRQRFMHTTLFFTRQLQSNPTTCPYAALS